MYFLLIGITLTCYVSAEFNRLQVPQKVPLLSHANGLKKSKSNVILPEDDIYVDKPDNKMLLPVPMEQIQAKKKLTKKHPKSPIQKIIARNRKNKKSMANRLTTKPTLPPETEDLVDDFEIDEKDDIPTTQAAVKAKFKKWTKKEPKYHSQIQKMQAKIGSKHRISKRHDRENTVIFQDLDEFEFLDRKKDYDIVKTHFKKYW